MISSKTIWIHPFFALCLPQSNISSDLHSSLCLTIYVSFSFLLFSLYPDLTRDFPLVTTHD